MTNGDDAPGLMDDEFKLDPDLIAKAMGKKAGTKSGAEGNCIFHGKVHLLSHKFHGVDTVVCPRCFENDKRITILAYKCDQCKQSYSGIPTISIEYDTRDRKRGTGYYEESMRVVRVYCPEGHEIDKSQRWVVDRDYSTTVNEEKYMVERMDNGFKEIKTYLENHGNDFDRQELPKWEDFDKSPEDVENQFAKIYDGEKPEKDSVVEYAKVRQSSFLFFTRKNWGFYVYGGSYRKTGAGKPKFLRRPIVYLWIRKNGLLIPKTKPANQQIYNSIDKMEVIEELCTIPINRCIIHDDVPTVRKRYKRIPKATLHICPECRKDKIMNVLGHEYKKSYLAGPLVIEDATETGYGSKKKGYGDISYEGFKPLYKESREGHILNDGYFVVTKINYPETPPAVVKEIPIKKPKKKPKKKKVSE